MNNMTAVSKKRARYESNFRLHHGLIAISPCFDMRKPRPLAIGIDREIKRHFPDATKQNVQDFLRWWCNRLQYVAAIVASDNRYHVDGVTAGKIDEAAKVLAEGKLKAKGQ